MTPTPISPTRPMPRRGGSSGSCRPASDARRVWTRPSWSRRCARSLAQSGFLEGDPRGRLRRFGGERVEKRGRDAQLEEARVRIEAPLERERLYAFARISRCRFARRFALRYFRTARGSGSKAPPRRTATIRARSAGGRRSRVEG